MANNHWLRRLACLALLVSAGCEATPQPVIVVDAAFPGASAQVLADTVAAPIEQQVNGVEKLLSMRSRCTSDGRYVLTVSFERGVDAAMAQVLVQNRVALAMPVLPAAVQAGGVTVKTKPAGVLLIVSLSSRGPFDGAYLSGYTAINIKDELARIPGVGAILQLPEFNMGLRVWLDPEKLTARGLTADDVSRALESQNLVVQKMPAIGNNDIRIDVKNMGRLEGPADLEDVIVKNDVGRTIRMRDLARVEPTGDRHLKSAQLNGKDVALLVIAPTPKVRPRELTAAVEKKLTLLEKHLPKGLRLDLAFDFTANVEAPGKQGMPEYLLLDVDVPADAAPERPAAILGRCEKILRDVDGVKDVLTLTDNPFDGNNNAPCILVRLIPASERKSSREEIAGTVRAQFREKLADATIRLRMPRAGWDHPIDLAIHGPKLEQVRKLATSFAERMRQEKKLTDVWLDRASEPRPQPDVIINREQAAKLGVKLADIQATLDIYRDGAPPGKRLDELKLLKIRNDRGAMVALSAIATMREVATTATVDRLDMRPMVRITANPAPGTSAADARKLCEALFRTICEELELPIDYRLSVSSAK
jgi:multidrug efflux pump subunit AcrB